jgi:hypothetical protein
MVSKCKTLPVLRSQKNEKKSKELLNFSPCSFSGGASKKNLWGQALKSHKKFHQQQ